MCRSWAVWPPSAAREPHTGAAGAARLCGRHLADGQRGAAPACGCGRAAIPCLHRPSALHRRRLPTRWAARSRLPSRCRSSTGAAGRWCRRISRPSDPPGWAIPPASRPPGLKRSAPAAPCLRTVPLCCCRTVPTPWRSTAASARGRWLQRTQPVFAAQGVQNTGRMLASLTALQELGLIEEQDGRWLPVAVTAKQDLASAPVLQRLATMAKQG